MIADAFGGQFSQDQINNLAEAIESGNLPIEDLVDVAKQAAAGSTMALEDLMNAGTDSSVDVSSISIDPSSEDLSSDGPSSGDQSSDGESGGGQSSDAESDGGPSSDVESDGGQSSDVESDGGPSSDVESDGGQSSDVESDGGQSSDVESDGDQSSDGGSDGDQSSDGESDGDQSSGGQSSDDQSNDGRSNGGKSANSGTSDTKTGPKKCFTGEQLVVTEHGQLTIAELTKYSNIKVRSITQDNKLTYSPVQFWLHANPTELTEYFTLLTESGHHITATAKHLLYITPCFGKNVSRIPVYAIDVMIGDCFLVTNKEEIITKSRVSHIQKSNRMGIYSPVTAAGSIVVNGVAASCYATYGHESTQHFAYISQRILFGLLPEYIYEALIHKGVMNGWQDIPHFSEAMFALSKWF